MNKQGNLEGLACLSYFYSPLAQAQTATLNLFQTPVGGTWNGVVLDRRHTNLTGTGGQWPKGSKFKLIVPRFVIMPNATFEDAVDILMKTILRLTIGTNKEYYFGLAMHFPQGFGAHGFRATTLNAANTNYGSNGEPNINNAFSFARGDEIILEQGDQFSWEMSFVAALAQSSANNLAGVCMEGRQLRV